MHNDFKRVHVHDDILIIEIIMFMSIHAEFRVDGNSIISFHIMNYSLREYCTPNQKLACFVLYLKIINTFLKNNICILK